jgi:hypothetical protein
MPNLFLQSTTRSTSTSPAQTGTINQLIFDGLPRTFQYAAGDLIW